MSFRNSDQRISNLVKEKGLSLNAVEKILGFGNGAIRRFDKNSPSIDKIIALSNFLNVSIDYLVNGEKVGIEIQQTSSDETEMLNLFKQLPERERLKEIGRLELLIEQLNTEENCG